MAMFAIGFVIVNVIVYAVASQAVSYFCGLENSKFKFKLDIDILKKKKKERNVNVMYF